VKIGQFVELDYSGRLDNGEIFDSTNPKEAEGAKGPLIIIMGAGHLIKGVEKALLEMQPGDQRELDIPPEDGFGRRDAKLIKLYKLQEFRKQQVAPYPGLRLTIDNRLGQVVSVSSGRIIVDFNHPLAGRQLHYRVKVIRAVEQLDEQMKGLLTFHFGEPPVYTVDGQTIRLEGVPEASQERLRTELLTYTVFKTVEFVDKKIGDKHEKHGQNSEKKV